MPKNIIKAITLSALDTATLVGFAFSDVNGTGLPESCFMVRIINNSKVNLIISLDGGATAHDVVNSESSLTIFDIPQANNYSANLAKGTVISVANEIGGASIGNVYVAGYYQPNS
jgi:hypothetical protein